MIQDDLEARNAAFLKLKSKILEEAIELSILCGAELAIFLASSSGDSPCSSMSHSQTLTDCDKDKQRDLDAQVEAEKSKKVE
ncbi:agamous-like MADS-box protein AGL29 [Senna tora]|uniref:Agamous-like MADS-box protein AGL29 n=1 Tax=Senna tora TaxID=362788 RepID=A0A835C7S9_9FABA|nr:agamous-like MADS-box protein AGL29 [Senna tora]